MKCVKCSIGEGEKDWQKFCEECSSEVDLYSRPLQDAAYHIVKLWEILQRRGKDGLNADEKDEIGKWVKFQEIIIPMAKRMK
jgi:hypothetical protein